MIAVILWNITDAKREAVFVAKLRQRYDWWCYTPCATIISTGEAAEAIRNRLVSWIDKDSDTFAMLELQSGGASRTWLNSQDARDWLDAKLGPGR